MALIPPTKNKVVEEQVPEEEPVPPVNLDDAESRMQFLKNQLNDMLDGINDNYGQDLMEELLKRLEKTIDDFNNQITDLIGKLKEGRIFEKAESTEETGTAFSEDVLEQEQAAAQEEQQDADIVKRMMQRAGHADD